MNLTDLVTRQCPPLPWTEGDNIPWNEPGFSARMLREHLSQEHDAASRRSAKIDAHVAWIQATCLRSGPARVLDLGCGPGLYAERLARLGHSIVGIDFSPASIAYARERAAAQKLDCRYQLADLRRAEYGAGYDLAMLLYGELNVFCPADARQILSQARAALAPTGALLLEASTAEATQRQGQAPSTWYTGREGLWSDAPFLALEESFWDEPTATATVRHYVISADTGAVARYAASYQAYTPDDYDALLAACGFGPAVRYPSLMGQPDPAMADFVALVAHPNVGKPCRD